MNTKKIFLSALVVLLFSGISNAQVGIGTNTPAASAQLDVSSTERGFLPPRMTSAQRDLIATPATGLLIFQTDNTAGYYYYNGTAWVSLGGASGSSGPSGPTGPTFPIPDVPGLSDIESITYEEYPDSTGVMKYRAILKIRNSSVNKDNVAGVDARIYNPNSTRSYVFGSGSASTTTTGPSGPTGPTAPVSPFVSNATWYNAKSVCDPVGGAYGSLPYTAGTAQYREDGVGVPSDSISGPTRARIKSVWRKTEEEALEAALNPACGIY
jgi:hypothetical protein